MWLNLVDQSETGVVEEGSRPYRTAVVREVDENLVVHVRREDLECRGVCVRHPGRI